MFLSYIFFIYSYKKYLTNNKESAIIIYRKGKKMNKAIGYIRVSTEEQANEGVSLQNQADKIKAYCSLNDLELVEIIEDAGKSAKTTNREGLQRLLSMVLDKTINAVVVYKLDRLSRKVIDTLNLIETFDKNNIAFHSITEKIDTQTALGKFFLNMTASLAQMERDLISERTKDALQGKIKRFERAGQIPYGYRLAPDSIHLIEEPEEQEAIRLIKELKQKDYSLRDICNELTIRGYKPVGYKWHPTTIKNILEREVA